jgi:hypothetical protein
MGLTVLMCGAATPNVQDAEPILHIDVHEIIENIFTTTHKFSKRDVIRKIPKKVSIKQLNEQRSWYF